MTLIEALDIVFSLAWGNQLEYSKVDDELKPEAIRQDVALEIACNFIQQVRIALWADQETVEVE